MSGHTLAMRLVLEAAEQCGEGECRLKDMPKTITANEEVRSMSADPQSQVADFHRACGLPVAPEPTVGTPEQRALRAGLIFEEFIEFIEAAGIRMNLTPQGATVNVRFEAIGEPDLVAMTHELADVQYVTSGTAVELGLPIAAAFSEVHAANMRKVGPDGKAVMRNGKVCKPEGWVPADVAKVLGE